MKTIADRLRVIGACPEAIDWAGMLKHRSMQRAWDECPRADWLLWYAAKRNVDQKKIVLAACACARTSLKYVPKGEHRPRKAIETAEAWTRGKAIEEVRNTANAAYAAADAAEAAAAAADAYAAAYAAAAYAADAAYAAAYAAAAYAADADAADAAEAAAAAADAYAAAYAAAAYAADAAYAYAAADADAAADAARSKAHLWMCKLVRKVLPKVPR